MFETHYLKPAEVQKILGIGKSGTYKLLNSEGFPLLRIGKLYRVSSKALHAWIAEQTNQMETSPDGSGPQAGKSSGAGEK